MSVHLDDNVLHCRIFSAVVILMCTQNSAFSQSSNLLPVNQTVSQETIYQTICAHGWTKTVRPSITITGPIKRKMMADVGVPAEAEDSIKLDHKIPLALGGALNDMNNFMLQPDDESKDKDRVEVCLARSVCAGKIELKTAQKAIWRDWRTAGKLCSGYMVIPMDSER